MPEGWFKSWFWLLGIAVGLITSPVLAGEKPLTWQDCVQEAASHNPDLISAENLVIKAKAQVGAARSDFFPEISGNAGYNASNSTNNSNFNPNAPITIDTGTRHQFQVGATFNQNIFEGFKTVAGYDKTKVQVEEQEQNLRKVKSQVSSDLKTAFAHLLFQQQQIGVDKKILDRRQENLRFVSLRFDGGRENKGSVMRSQALYDQAKFNLSESERGLKVARRELAKALGRDYSLPNDQLEVKGTFDTHLPKAPPDISGITSAHPEHGVGEAQVNEAKEDVRIAKADLYPSIDASASFTRRKFESSNAASLYSAGVNLNYPFFTGGRDIYEAKAARIEQYRLGETLRSTDNRLALTLKQSYTDFKDAVDKIKVQEGFLKAAETRAEIARSQYANGLLSYQDWDLIENDLIDNQRTILESLRDALIAEAAYEKAQGIGAIP